MVAVSVKNASDLWRLLLTLIQLAEEGICRPVLLGRPPRIAEKASRQGLDLGGVEIIYAAEREEQREEFARQLFERLFFHEKRYDLADVGRYKMNRRLSLDVDPKSGQWAFNRTERERRRHGAARPGRDAAQLAASSP